MAASEEHDLIVALVTRRIRQQGFQIVALEASLSWLFGESFRWPPTIVHHRPDVLGVRPEPPYIHIGEAKTCADLVSARTARQLTDFGQLEIDGRGTHCAVTIGIPQYCEPKLRRLLDKLNIPLSRINILSVPGPLLTRRAP